MQNRRKILLDELFIAVESSKATLKQGLNQYGYNVNPEYLNQQIHSNNQQEESLRREIEQFKRNMAGYDISSFNNQMKNYEQRIEQFQNSTASLKKQMKEYDESIKKIDEIDKDMERLAGFVDKPAEEFMQAVGVFYKKYRDLCANSAGGYGCYKVGSFDKLIQESQNEEMIDKLKNISRLNMERNSDIKDNSSGGDIQKILMIFGMIFLACIFYKRRKRHMKDVHCQKNNDEENIMLIKENNQSGKSWSQSVVSNNDSQDMGK